MLATDSFIYQKSSAQLFNYLRKIEKLLQFSNIDRKLMDTEISPWYTYFFLQNTNYGFGTLIVVVGFTSSVRHSKLRQIGLPTRNLWRIIECLLKFQRSYIRNFRSNPSNASISRHSKKATLTSQKLLRDF